MFFYIILLALTSVYNSWSMTPPIVALKDNQNNIVANTDAKTLQDLQSLSAHIASRSVEEVTEGNQKKYVVSTGLPKKLITFLLQLNANKESKKIFAALNAHYISLDNIAPSEVDTLGLTGDVKKIFDDFLIIETTIDNQYTTLKKTIIPLFSTIADVAQDFKDQFIIPIGEIKKQDLINLYMLIYNLSQTQPFLEWIKNPSSFIIWNQNIQYIQHLVREKSSADILTLIETANFLGATPLILTGLYQGYKTRFLKLDDWQKELQSHPILEDIEYEIEHVDLFPSIEMLLKQGKKDFYSVKMEKSTVINKDILTARIKGPSVYFLKGLNTIPDIIKCEALYIEDTQIISLKTNDLDKLNNLKEIVFLNNKNLRILEKNSLRKFDVRFLRIKGNNITAITPGVFILNQLKYLNFEENNIQVIQTNWALELPTLNRLILEELQLNILEPGWLNGLKELHFLEVNPNINPALDAQIKNELSTRPEISYIKSGAL